MLCYTKNQTRALCNEQQLRPLQIPSDDNGHFTAMYPWKVCSLYEATDGIFYHLHPELVDVERNSGIASVKVCPTCLKQLQQKHLPRLSIAAGVDFGYYRRLENLQMPNLHESIILSLHEVVHVTIKISSNHCGHVNFGLNRLKAHVILWPQMSVTASIEQLNPNIIFNNDYLKRHSFVKYYFLDPSGKNFDHMAKMAFSSGVLLPRPWILYQWFLVLFRVHCWYTVDDFPSYTQFEEMIRLLISDIKEAAVKVNNPNDIHLENAIGSDVAQVQSTEQHANPFDSDETFDSETVEVSSLPLPYSFIIASSMDNSMNNKSKLAALQSMVDNGLTQQDYHETAVPATLDNNDNNRLSNDISDCFDGLVDADFESEEETHPAISSIRGQQPVSEFDSTD